jgi:hypothetical protein
VRGSGENYPVAGEVSDSKKAIDQLGLMDVILLELSKGLSKIDATHF